MDKVSALSPDERRDLFSQTANQKNMTPAIVEKDFWVCWVLMKLFANPELSSKILFKGGTSLSKIFHAIERFSEDIDLVLDWRVLTRDDAEQKRSRTQQDKWNKNLVVKANDYIESDLLNYVRMSVGEFCRADVDEKDGEVINIHYPGVFDDQYLRPEIRLEIGPLASWIPHDQYDIVPYAAEAFPHVFSLPKCRVHAIKVERTFWEKTVILHKEAFRSIDSVQPLRHSRHYYDLAKMDENSAIREKAFVNIDLLEKVVQFKQQYYPSAWARYDLAKIGSIKLMPPTHLEKALREDYLAMRNMIFGECPTFDDVIDSIGFLEREINL